MPTATAAVRPPASVRTRPRPVTSVNIAIPFALEIRGRRRWCPDPHRDTTGVLLGDCPVAPQAVAIMRQTAEKSRYAASYMCPVVGDLGASATGRPRCG